MLKYYFAKMVWTYDIPFLSPLNGSDWVVRNCASWPWLSKEQFIEGNGG